jgi:aspartyl/asparaginyl beta-hydroxylase (cupin superfamily)
VITKDSFVYRTIAAPGLKLIAAAEWLISKNSPNNPFFDANSFPWVKTLENSYPQIKKELYSLLQSNTSIPAFSQLSEEQKRIVPDDKWKTFIFCVYGKYIAKNCRLCPTTSSAIRNIPGIRGAMFSILEPRTHISRHRGPYKGVLRCHLAIMVPQNEKLCAIQVDQETRFWEEGKTLVFDDSFEHEAWNNSDEVRVVLFVDFERALPIWLVPINKFMLWLLGVSPFARNILANIERYEK